jgi:hypothetical protein
MFCGSGHVYFKENTEDSPYNYLEIGVFYGESVGLLADAYPHKQVFAVDPFIEDGFTSHTSGVDRGQRMPTQRESTLKNIAGKKNAYLIEKTSKEFSESLEDWVVQLMNVGWVLIDGSHHYEDVVIDYELAMRLIGDKKGGIVFDDVNIEGVAKAHKEFIAKYGNRITGIRDISQGEPGSIMAYKIN